MNPVVYHLKNLISSDVLKAFQTECDSNYKQIVSKSSDDENNRSCSIDMFEDIPIPEAHSARLFSEMYFAKRWQNNAPNEYDRTCMSKFLIESAPSLIGQILCWDSVYLFNENYIVKSSKSDLEFRWHTDEQEQFKCSYFMSEEDGDVESISKHQEYVSLWCALDFCDEENGSLVVPINTRVISIDCDTDDVLIGKHAPLDRAQVGTKRKHDVSQIPQSRPTAEEHGKVLRVSPGSAVLFSSRVWHRSGPNKSDLRRRVFYIQYSPLVITGNEHQDTVGHKKDSYPLSFAVKCKTE